jgi:phosphoglycerol geranylgeranyltransferase
MSRLASLVRRVSRLGRLVSVGGRTALSLDTNPVPADWTHITKVDPEREKRLPLAYPLYLSHTGAVSVGGSQDVTNNNTEETFAVVNAADVPAFHEPSAADHVTGRTRDAADFMAVPEVLNGDSEALVGKLGRGIEHVREELAPTYIDEKLPIPLGEGTGDRLSAFAGAWMMEEAVFEAYIIMNLDSAAAREANVTEADLLDPEAAKHRAIAAENHLDSEVVYVEYSGTFGGEEAVDILKAVDEGVSWSRVWYGGGLDSREDARTVLEAGADAVVVGNVFHEVADEEADLYAAASEAFATAPDRETVRDFVESEVDTEATHAASYLSTITAVPDPERRATRYLTAGVHTALQLRDIAEGLSDPDAAALRAAIPETPPGASALADAVEDADGLARQLGTALLAERTSVADDGLPVNHIGLTL